jgi:hypothetical protein
VIDPSDYARQIETYLCQKNRGHLIRVVGPAFDLVCGWASSGVPLKVAFRGIDRCCERHDARGPRRRPIRIEFCEADVLDAFDAWRRALGVGRTAGEPGGNGEAGEPAPRKAPLAAHIERAIAKLAHRRGTGDAETALHRQIDQTIRELEQVAASALRARGETRSHILGRLVELDAALMAAATEHLEASLADRLRIEASEELAPFGARMPAEAKARALQAAFQRLVRETFGLPTLNYD